MVNKLRIGIVTLHYSNNYGAVFQTYALSKYLESLGHDVFILNYHMERTSIFEYLKHPIVFFRKVCSKKALTWNFLSQKIWARQGKQREKPFDTVFDDFRKKYLKITDAVYDYQKLVDNCPEADIFITGSDQVWAADFFFSSPAYLLGFVPSTAKRISYAPSFGKSRLEPYLHMALKDNLSKFDAVSVREKSGVGIVKDVAGLDASHVVDPTLLLEDYCEIVDYSLVPQDSYVLAYRLNQEYQLASWMSESIDKICETLRLPLLSVSTNCPWDLNIKGKDVRPTPGQLLGLIERASFVLTNSFHGTVFSILFRVKFLTFARDTSKEKQNLRMTELLSSIGLSSLYCPPLEEFETLCKKLDCEIDYDSTYEQLDELRSLANNFVNNALR